MLRPEDGFVMPSSLPRRVLLVAGLFLTLGVAVTACGLGASGADSPTGKSEYTHSDRGIDPAVANASPAQKLDRSLSYPGMRGMVFGVVLDEGRGVTQGEATYTDYRFKVEAAFASAHATYSVGSIITVQAPGGVGRDGTTSVVEGAPAFRRGGEYYLWVQDQPRTGLAGGSAAGLLPVPNVANSAAVGSSVTWLGATFDRGAFEQALRGHPAS